ncbi:MAG: aminotransferase [Candidatus Buchananbacteria bacterium CG10_big_fil_rev_8_21_14_0_10_42_9]|uniref:Aminotransferase n=1 Tax=Candidatus Buchananbacteria bacterium CG10_big_fil_rev_8_21_14_0_10_42_9 TaxID=1974526 RepID=A0A2H0W2D0_9BACT|nr:MAG: aminotransferase [Candidatus Buchananbacteria bacterium CG10_big_fil_rev_8_21_14_0_10_42_9]
MEFAKRLAEIQVSPIKQMEYRASKISDVVSLAQGIPSFDTPEVIKDNVKAAMDADLVARYSLPQGLPELRDMISQKLAQDHMFYDSETEIIVTCGAIEALSATFQSILNHGDEVVLVSPSYASYPELIKVAGGKPIFADLVENEGWRLDVTAIEKKISRKTKALLICNPNNPTGTIFTKQDLTSIAELALQNGLFLVLDEVYKDFVYGEEPFYFLAQEKKYRQNIIRIFSLSKSYAMTGWRIAYLHSAAENIVEILKVHDSLVTCAPVVSQYGAYTALQRGDGAVKEFTQVYNRRRNLMCHRLDKMEKYLTYQTPGASYFILPKVLVRQGSDSWKFCINLLEQAKVALVPGVAFGPSGEGHVRISFGRSDDDINLAFDRMEKFFEYL